MNPQVLDLIQRVMDNDISMDVFYARMSQLGITTNEAQTMLSAAAGGSPQALDPALDADRSQPLSQSDIASAEAYRSARPEQTVPPGTPQPSRPMTQEEIALLRPVEERQPLLPRVFGQMGQDVRRALTQEPSTMPQSRPVYGSPQGSTGGASAGQQIAQQPQAQPTGSYYGQDDFPIGSAYEPTPYQRTGPLADRATVQRAIDVAKTRSAAPAAASEVASTQETPMGFAQLLRGRFGEAGKGNVLEDRLTAAQEARDAAGSGMARGGTVEGKAGKDAALHKALEIIHHLISTR